MNNKFERILNRNIKFFFSLIKYLIGENLRVYRKPCDSGNSVSSVAVQPFVKSIKKLPIKPIRLIFPFGSCTKRVYTKSSQ